MKSPTTKCTFDHYLIKKTMTAFEISKLSIPRRKEFFLRWKWGSEDPQSNNECESTRQGFVSDLLRMEISAMPLTEREYFSRLLKFEDYCRQIKERIDLLKDQPHE